jgi:hypothetical protein
VPNILVKHGLLALLTAFTLSHAQDATSSETAALEPWQLSAGAFVTASDVTAHNRLPQDRADILAAASEGSWQDALVIYGFGKNFPWRGTTHSYGRFADNYNGVLPRVVPDSVQLYGSPVFMDSALNSALRGTGAFAGASEEERIAFIDTGLLAATLNWTRFELVMAETKATANEPNWSLENGAPKNWNEIFAFYYGPEGRHSLYEALAGLPGGENLSQRLFEVLAEGQESLLEQQWPEAAASEVAALLDEAARLLFVSALEEGDEHVEAYLRGYWLAAAESFSKADPSQAQAVHAHMSGDLDLAALRENVGP